MQTAYEYGYAFDGGRRWRKDYANNVWTWYPCGVACSAGELVEMQSDLTGAVWTTTALYLKGLSIVRRNSEYHHFDLNGAAGVITDANGAVLSNNLYDSFGVQRFASGSAATPWRWGRTGDEGTVANPAECLPGRATPLKRSAAAGIGFITCFQARLNYGGTPVLRNNICRTIGKMSCDKLFGFCCRIPGNNLRQLCMGIYLSVCWGE